MRRSLALLVGTLLGGAGCAHGAGGPGAHCESEASAPVPAVVHVVPASPEAQGPFLTADTDPTRLRDGVAEAPAEKSGWCGRLLGPTASCRILLHGPLQVSDVIATHSDCAGQSVVVLRGDSLRLRLEGTATLRGARISLAAGDVLVLVQDSAPAAIDAGPSAPKERRDCGVYWSGFAPYGTEPAPPIELTEFLGDLERAASGQKPAAATGPRPQAEGEAAPPSPTPNPYR